MSVTRRFRLGATAAAVALGAALAAVPAVSADPGYVPAGAVKMSDEFKLTTWAFSISLAPIRDRPSLTGRSISRLRLKTELGGPEAYLVLTRWRDPEGLEWLRIRVPGRPNGRIGWVSSQALGDLRRTTLSVEVQRKRNRVLVRRKGKVVMRARIGHGKPGTPTPGGRYWIRDRFTVKTGGLYGPRALGTAAYAPTLTDWPLGGVIGFHGTNQPQLIPGRPSNGCIRMRNADIKRFYRLVKRGTPVHIR